MTSKRNRKQAMGDTLYFRHPYEKRKDIIRDDYKYATQQRRREARRARRQKRALRAT